MSKSWIRTILLMALAVLCLVGAIVMKKCGKEDAVAAPYVDADSASTAASSEVEADSSVISSSSNESNTEIEVVFDTDEEEVASSDTKEQDKEPEAATSVPVEQPAPAATPAAAENTSAAAPAVTAAPTQEPTPVPTPEATSEPTPVPEQSNPVHVEPEQNTGYADNGWQPEAVEHYHGNGSDSGTCPACGLIYGPAGGAEGQYGEQDGLMD